MQHLKNYDYLTSYIEYASNNNIKLDQDIDVQYSFQIDKYKTRRNFYYDNLHLVEEHLLLIPSEVKKVVDAKIDKDREFIINSFGGC